MKRLSLVSTLLTLALAMGCDKDPLPTVDGGVAIDAGLVVPEVAVAADLAAGEDRPSPPDAAPIDVPISTNFDGAPDVPRPQDPAPDAGPPDLARVDVVGREAGLQAVRALDLLFVVDNSPSMEQEQANLRANFPALMKVLERLPGGLPDVHIGVVSTDLGAGTGVGTGACARQGGDRAIFQTKPSCGLSGEDRFIRSHNSGTMNNFSGDISQVFSCMADLGIRGCGFEHQLQAARVALYEAITPENTGFLRRDAVLGIVIISDEDDCSGESNSDFYSDPVSYPGTTASFRCAHTGHVCSGATPPLGEFQAPLASCQASDSGRLIKINDIVDSIRALKARPDQEIVVAGIFGWPADGPSGTYRWVREREGIDLGSVCNSANQGEAYPGLRLKKFVESFGPAGSYYSVCDADYTPALTKIAEKLVFRL